MKKNYSMMIPNKLKMQVTFTCAFLLFIFETNLNAQCLHTVRISDDYGDGWNGGSVKVRVGGVDVLTDLTISSGYGPEDFTFIANTGQTISVIQTLAGSYPVEMLAEVIDYQGLSVIPLHNPVSGSGTSGIGNCPAALIDDVEILKRYSQNILTTVDYSIVPNTQRRPLESGVQLINNGPNDLTNQTLSITINDGTTNVYTGSQTYSVLAGETKYVWKTTNYTPAINKNYVITFTIPVDDVTSNNTGTTTFKTQEGIYAHDYTSSEKLGFDIDNELSIGNLFEIHNNQTLYSVDVEFEAGTTAGMPVTIKIVNATAVNTNLATANYTILAGNIGNGITTNIPLSTPLNLVAGQSYVAYVSKLANTNRLYIGASNFGADDYSTILYGPFGPGDQVGHYQDNTKAPFVRMNFAAGCGDFTSILDGQDSQGCLANSGSIMCSSSGSIAVQNQYIYSWTGAMMGSSGPNQNSNYTISNLAPGNYNITVTNGACSFSSSSAIVIGSISVPTISTSSTPISCFGADDGTVSYGTSGSISGYNFSWNVGGSAPSILNASAGTYTINGTNGICNITSTVVLNEPAEIAINPVTTNTSSCATSNGSIAITVTGGVPGNYLYTWTGSTTGSSGAGFGTSFNMTALPAGNYVINVANGNCQNQVVASVNSNGSPTITISQVTPISCFGSLNGSIKVTATASISAYTFTWSNGGTGIQLNNIGTGTYSVSGTNGTCTISDSYEFLEPQQLNVTGTAGISSITLNISGGTGSSTYAWTGPNGFTSTNGNLSQLNSLGDYTVTVTDQNGCTDSQTFTVSFVGNEEISNAKSKFNVYPNPASQTITFELNQEVSEIVITDFTGKIVNQISVSSNTLYLNVLDKNDGIYFYSLFDKAGNKLHTDKFTVIK